MEGLKKQRLSRPQLLLILSGLIPLVAYAFGIIWLFAQQQEKTIARIIDEAANNAAHIVARAIAEQVGVLETLSSSKFMDSTASK